MAKDKYSATWVSHTSMGAFLQCPRSYYLKNVYKDPKTNHKVQLMAPALALGQVVHEVIESLSVIPTNDRFKDSLMEKYEKAWKKISGKRGGFRDESVEFQHKERGAGMIRKVMENPGPLKNLAVKIKQDLPQYWLSEEDNIILCGKIDWLEYLKDSDSVHIIDFKTSKKEESGTSLQLPIYHLLVHNTQHRKVGKASYWYLSFNDELTEKKLPDLDEAHETVMQVAKKVKLARQLNRFKCPKGDDGCFYCKPMESILKGEAEYVGENNYRNDVYIAGIPAVESSRTEDKSMLI